jgi:hypothetical protein
MPSQYPSRWLAFALVAPILIACGPRPDPASVTADDADSGGLPTKDDDAGLGTKDDSGLGTKDDSGLGTKDDAGLGTDDAGLGTKDDAGEGTDAGGGTEDSGMPGLPDGGGFGGCFACAEEKCSMQTACINSATRVEEAQCDLVCVDESAGHGPSSQCVEACTKGLKATPNLLEAMICAFTSCSKECHSAVSCFRGGTP